ncbi:MAG: biotin-dependent carboxyltransferase family protein [Gemmataceae bacterium]
MSLRLIHPGLLSLLVDAGRTRWRSLGVPLGGAADRSALAIGNALVGNSPAAPALEFTLAGPTLEAIDPAACAIFGAPFTCTINGKPGPDAGTTFTLDPGDVLKIGGTASGARGYLCVAGGFDAAETLGSCSSLEPLAAGEELACSASRCEPRGLGFAALPHDSSLRVLNGPQRDWFDDSFFQHEYEVSPASNRMGVRLTGEPLTRSPGELASEAVAPGAVQITNDGRPVILGVDGQTIGGYPKIAHVIRADVDRVGRLRPGERVRFIAVNETDAERLATERAETIRGWLARLRAADREPLRLTETRSRSGS